MSSDEDEGDDEEEGEGSVPPFLYSWILTYILIYTAKNI